MAKYALSYYPKEITGENLKDPYYLRGMARELASGFKVFETDDFSELDIVVLNYCWSPVVFYENRRKQDYFAYSSVCALDCDGTLSLSNAKRAFAPYTRIFGTTKSHTKRKNRFRAIFPFPDRITSLYQYREAMKYLTQVYRTDRACTDGARFFYPCKSIVHCSLEENRPITYRLPKPRRSIQSKNVKFSYDKEVLPKHIKLFIERGITFGVGRNQSAYLSGLHLAKCGLEISKSLQMVENGAAQYICGNDFPRGELVSAFRNGYRAGA